MTGGAVSHLPSTVAALAAQVLAVGQQPSGARTLEGEPGVNEGRRATVVVHKEGLRIEMSCMDRLNTSLYAESITTTNQQ